LEQVGFFLERGQGCGLGLVGVVLREVVDIDLGTVQIERKYLVGNEIEPVVPPASAVRWAGELDARGTGELVEDRAREIGETPDDTGKGRGDRGSGEDKPVEEAVEGRGCAGLEAGTSVATG